MILRKTRQIEGNILTDFLKAALDAGIRFLSGLFQAEVKVSENIQRIVTKFDESKASIEHEVALIRDFKFNPSWKTKVINVPAAVKNIQGLIEFVTTDFKDRMNKFREPIHQLSLIFKVEGSGDVGQAGVPSGLSRAAVKVDEIATMIAQLADAMDEIADWAAFFESLTERIQGLDDIFLQQNNPRKLVDGKHRTRKG